MRLLTVIYLLFVHYETVDFRLINLTFTKVDIQKHVYSVKDDGQCEVKNDWTARYTICPKNKS